MVSVSTEKWVGKASRSGHAIYYREGECLSTDTKPTAADGWANGSKLIEMDTSKVFMFDEANSQWREF